MDNDANVTFISNLEVIGFVNGVINMALSTSQFVPKMVPIDPDSTAGAHHLVVVPEAKITANLRFDLWVAQIIRDRLDEIIQENTKPRVMS